MLKNVLVLKTILKKMSVTLSKKYQQNSGLAASINVFIRNFDPH